MKLVLVPPRRRSPDLEVRRLTLQLAATRLVDVTKLSVAAARRNWQLGVKAFASRDRVASVIDEYVEVGGRRIALRIYRTDASTRPAPALLWFHGGGFVLGDLYTAGATCRALARRSGAVVIAVDYRLAPEHGLAEARDDGLAALRWLEAHASRLAIDPARIGVGGDSAGGALAALVAQRAPERVALQVLAYPATDLTRAHASSADGSPLFSSAHIAWLRSHMARHSDLDDPSLSPLAAASLARLPPTLMVTTGFDPLRDEALAYAQGMVDAGVPVRVLHYPGQFHGFLTFDRVLAGARDALDRVGAAVAAHFAGEAVATGVTAVRSPSRALLDPRWLLPRQRWNELVVGWLFARDRLSARSERTSHGRL